MSKDDEYVLINFSASCRVDDGVGYIRIIHVQIATQNAPQNALEDRNTRTFDGTSDKSMAALDIDTVEQKPLTPNQLSN